MLSAAGLGGTAIAASIAIPSLISARIEANERVAVQTLRRIAAAEDKLHVAKALDADRDGRAEYGRLADLVKKAAGHGLAQPSAPPLVDDQLLTPQEGFGEKSGYVFWVGFPEPDVATPAPRRAAANVNTADSAEAQFIAYAWPKSCGQTGLKIYAIDAAGQLYYSDNTSPGQYWATLTCMATRRCRCRTRAGAVQLRAAPRQRRRAVAAQGLSAATGHGAKSPRVSGRDTHSSWRCHQAPLWRRCAASVNR
ncbi:MAG: hypothetical protein U1E76_09375 [Planctomycetota bacterium]